MKILTLKDLKEDLAKWTELAHKGQIIQVTKYNKPYLLLAPCEDLSIRRGSLVGTSPLAPAIHLETRGTSLKFLEEDRDE
jgi:antitoxin (DNA-binding transcriptional repressor) of toxin-antitoxin stability system